MAARPTDSDDPPLRPITLPMKQLIAKNLWPLLLTILTIFAVDHLAKYGARVYLEPREHQGLPYITIIPGLFRLDYEVNPGGAFSILADKPKLLTSIATLTVLIVLAMALTTPRDERVMRWCFGFILGGAIANLTDRYVRGHVIDFFDVYWGSSHFPTFNVADVCISTASFVLAGRILFGPPPVSDAPVDGQQIDTPSTPVPPKTADSHPRA